MQTQQGKWNRTRAHNTWPPPQKCRQEKQDGGPLEQGTRRRGMVQAKPRTEQGTDRQSHEWAARRATNLKCRQSMSMQVDTAFRSA